MKLLLVTAFVSLYWCIQPTSAILCQPYHKYALPNNCTGFVTCDIDRKLVTLQCPPGLHFNIRSSACDWPDVANCTREDPGRGRNATVTAVRRGYMSVIVLRMLSNRNASVKAHLEKTGNITTHVVRKGYLHRPSEMLRNETVRDDVNFHFGKHSFNNTKRINASVASIKGKQTEIKDYSSLHNTSNKTAVKTIPEDKQTENGLLSAAKPVLKGRVVRSISIREVKVDSKKAENNTNNEEIDVENVKDKKLVTSENVKGVNSNVTEVKNLTLVKEITFKEKLSQIINATLIKLAMNANETDLKKENKTESKESNFEQFSDVEFVPVSLNSTSKQNIFGYKIVDTFNSTVENLTKSEILASGGNVSRTEGEGSSKIMNSTVIKEVKNTTISKELSKSENATVIKASSKNENVTNKETTKKENETVSKDTPKNDGKTKDKVTLIENKNETTVKEVTKNENSTISKQKVGIEISKVEPS